MLARRDESKSNIKPPYPLVAGHSVVRGDACRYRLGEDAKRVAVPETQSHHRTDRNRCRDIAAHLVDVFLARAESPSLVRHLWAGRIGCALCGDVPGAWREWRLDATC